MAKSFNRHFQFLGSSKQVRPSGPLWLPAADVYQTEDGWVVKVELAGVAAEDVEIEVQGNVLYIAGCRKDRSCAAGVAYHQMEISYSRFARTPGIVVRLPSRHSTSSVAESALPIANEA